MHQLNCKYGLERALFEDDKLNCCWNASCARQMPRRTLSASALLPLKWSATVVSRGSSGSGEDKSAWIDLDQGRIEPLLFFGREKPENFEWNTGFSRKLETHPAPHWISGQRNKYSTVHHSPYMTTFLKVCISLELMGSKKDGIISCGILSCGILSSAIHWEAPRMYTLERCPNYVERFEDDWCFKEKIELSYKKTMLTMVWINIKTTSGCWTTIYIDKLEAPTLKGRTTTPSESEALETIYPSIRRDKFDPTCLCSGGISS